MTYRIPAPRRRFLKVAGGALVGSSFGFLARLPSVSAADARLDPKLVPLHADIEPLVRFLEGAPRDRLLEELGARIGKGLPYREVMTALLLAGVRNIQPRPVGFKFHAVLAVHAAHLAAMNSPATDRWLPVFWALDDFKSSQLLDIRAGDWAMQPVNAARVPSADATRRAFASAMDAWDESRADPAAASLSRHLSQQESFEILCRYGARDFRDIGHKAIYVANGFRMLDAIGWRHAEPVIRSMAYALLDRGWRDPSGGDLAEDRPWKRNLVLQRSIRADWAGGAQDPSATTQMLTTLRTANDDHASDAVVAHLNRGVAPQSVSDAFFLFAAELMMKRPAIVPLHAVTTTNALQFAFRQSTVDETRRMLLLQNAAFLVLFRDLALRKNQMADPLIERFEPVGSAASRNALEGVFTEIGRNRSRAASHALGYFQSGGTAEQFVAMAQRFIYLKGTDAHDYKFSSATLEDYRNVSPQWRDRFLAASVSYFYGPDSPDSALVARSRAALDA
ncbi:MAG: hypothetical protein ACKVQT_36280 [Burkholderiales bacterium]